MDFLATILAKKAEEVAQLPESEVQIETKRPSFYQTVKDAPATVHLIGEIKRASPSKGDIRTDVDILAQARAYETGGVSAISVLTDEVFFKGTIDDLEAVAQVVELPILCKDFIIDERQLVRAKNAGASIVLLIVAALTEKRLAELFQAAKTIGLEVLVETHNQQELEVAHRIGAKIIGVNNRDLTTFEVTIATSEALAQPSNDRVYISESGFKNGEDVQRIAKDYQAVLVGETLMRSDNISEKIKELRVKRT
ncbi:indole-3-glycerol phosphate synthase TrpC [Enterococcus sp. AZ072]|uniref:indole-3-glycerol phosphate synthase TrpC n=1 Tax=unclassified Enterococcus TaxID=2608891 RepID=UPI003D298370